MKSLTVRLPDVAAQEIELVAEVDNMPLAEAIRLAIAAYAHSRKATPEWRKALRARVDTYRALGEVNG